MRTLQAVTVCALSLVLLTAGPAVAVLALDHVYTSALARDDEGQEQDGGNQYYTSATHLGTFATEEATAEVSDTWGDLWVLGDSKIAWHSCEWKFPEASTSSELTISLLVVNTGQPISFDYTITGLFDLSGTRCDPYAPPLSTSYDLAVSDDRSGDSHNRSDFLSLPDSGSDSKSINTTHTYDFNDQTYAGGTWIDVTLDLDTRAWADYGWYPNSFAHAQNIKVTLSNFQNLVPEPAMLTLLGVGLVGVLVGRRRR